MEAPTRALRVLRVAIAGFVAGAIGTLAMSLVMLLAARLDLLGTAPPRRVVDEALEHVPSAEAVNATGRNVLATVLHFAVGVVAGGIHAVTFASAANDGRRRIPSGVFGAAF